MLKKYGISDRFCSGLRKWWKEFADFLEKTQSTEVASLYNEVSELYRTLPGTTDLAAALNEIADIEEDAREIY